MRHNSDDIAPILSAVRLMDRFFAEARQEESADQAYLDRLQLRYMDLLNDDLARFALDLARALVHVEDRITDHRRKVLGRLERQRDRRQRSARSKRG